MYAMQKKNHTSAPVTQKPKVLVIDDTRTVLAMTQAILERAGFEVLTRSEPIGSGAVIMREKPDLVLIDLCMPLLTGDSIVSLLGNAPWRKEVKVVLFSNRPMEEIEQRANECGADGAIHKGSHTSLIMGVWRALGQRPR